MKKEKFIKVVIQKILSKNNQLIINKSKIKIIEDIVKKFPNDLNKIKDEMSKKIFLTTK